MKLYSEMQVAVATFLGSPLAGGILMSHNAKVAGQEKEKKNYLIITSAASVALLVLAFFLPERKPGNYLIPLAASWAMRFWYQKVQADFLGGTRFPEAKKASWWLALGISLLVVVGIIALLILAVIMFPSIVSDEA